MGKRRSGAPLLDLTNSNPTQALAAYPHDAVRAAYGTLADFTYRPDPLGNPQARRAIADSYLKRGLVISPDQLALTSSTSEAYSVLFKLLCDPGDEILVPLPSYPLFEYLAALESIRVVPYRLRYDGGWFIDFDSLCASVSAATKAIIVVNPNNPTGSFLKLDELRVLFEIAANSQVPLISDEVFMDYEIRHQAGRAKTLAGCNSHLSFSLNGLSKMACMPQMKLAWIAVNGPEMDRETAIRRLELILDTYLSVSGPVQAASAELFRIGDDIRDQLVAIVRRNAASATRILRSSGTHLLHVEGGWSAILQLPKTMPEEDWIKKLIQECGVITQPGFFFDMESEPYAVISLITPCQEFDEGLARIASATA